MKSKQIQAIRGMNDVLPDEAPLWEFFEDTVRSLLRSYGYRMIRTPVLEQTELIVRGVSVVYGNAPLADGLPVDWDGLSAAEPAAAAHLKHLRLCQDILAAHRAAIAPGADGQGSG